MLRYSTHLFFHSRIPPELLIPRVAFHQQLFLLNNQESHVKCQKRIKKWSSNYNFTFILYLTWHWSFYSCFKRCFIKDSGSLFSHYIRFNGDCILLKTITTVRASQIPTVNQKKSKINGQINEEQDIPNHSNTVHNCQQWQRIVYVLGIQNNV